MEDEITRRFWQRTFVFLALLAGFSAVPSAESGAQDIAAARALFKTCYFQHKGDEKAIGSCVARGLTPAPKAGEKVRIPSVNGELSATALVRLEDAGFAARLDAEQAVETIDQKFKGRVALTIPPAGSEAAKGAVVLVVPYDYRRPSLDETISTPAVVNKGIAEAIRVLRSHGLRGEVGDPVYNSKIEWSSHTGFVAEQKPAAGNSVKRGDTVVLRPGIPIVGGIAPQQGDFVFVPNVRGKLVAKAIAELKEAGFAVRAVPDDIIPTTTERWDGRVANQVPGANQVVARGTTISLIRYVKDAEGGKLVPNLRGLTLAGAHRLAGELSLSVGAHSTALVPTEQPELAGRVAKQQPPAGTRVRRDTTVTVYLYETADQMGDMMQVPQVTYQTPEVAGRKLQDAGLRVALGPGFGARYKSVPTYNRTWDGLVARQVPEGATWVERNSVVQLHIHALAQEMEMPDLRGVTWAAAEQRLKSYKLSYVRDQAVVPTTDPSRNLTVAETDPSPGHTLVLQGDPVQVKLYAWAGPEGNQVHVPNVIGMTKAKAQAKLKAAGLHDQGTYYASRDAQATDNRTLDGTVARQDPPPMQFVKQGSVVRLTVFALARFKPVPELAGKTHDDAATTLSREGFRFQPVTAWTDDELKAGMVAGTHPPAGRKAPIGMPPPVKLSIFKKRPVRVDEPLGDVPVTVLTAPDVAGRQAQETGDNRTRRDEPTTGTGQGGSAPTVLKAPPQSPPQEIGNPVVSAAVHSTAVYLDRLQMSVGRHEIYYASWTDSRTATRRLNLRRNKAAVPARNETVQIRLLFTEGVKDVAVRAGGFNFTVERDGADKYHKIVTDTDTLAQSNVDGWITFEISAVDMQGRLTDGDPGSKAMDAGPDKSHRVAFFAAMEDLPYSVEPFEMKALFNLEDPEKFAAGATRYTAWGKNGKIAGYDYEDKRFTVLGSTFVKLEGLMSRGVKKLAIPCPEHRQFGCEVEDPMIESLVRSAPGVGSQFEFDYGTFCTLCKFQVMVQVELFKVPLAVLARSIAKTAKSLGMQPLETEADTAYWLHYDKAEHENDKAVVVAVLGNAVVGLYFGNNSTWTIGNWTFDGTPKGYGEAVKLARQEAAGRGNPDPHPGAVDSLSYESVSRAIIAHVKQKLPHLNEEVAPTVLRSSSPPGAQTESAEQKAERLCLAAVKERNMEKKGELIEQCSAARKEVERMRK